jgi:hypothetical protein
LGNDRISLGVEELGTRTTTANIVEQQATSRPILVTGAHRSGTGWVGQSLTRSTAAIGYIWEPFSIRARPGILDLKFPYWFPYLCDENGEQYRPAIEKMLAWRYRPLAELSAVGSPKDAARMARDWSQFVLNRWRRATPLLKDPIALFSAEWLARSFGMRVVVLLRHPAAFAASLKRLGWRHPFDHFLAQPLLMRDHLSAYTDEIRHYARHEQDIVDQAILLWRLIYDVVAGFRERHPHWAFLRLEDLSRDPLPCFRELFASLEVPFGEQVEEWIRATTDPNNPAEASRPDSVRRDSRSHVSNWKRTLTTDEVERVYARTSSLAGRFYGATDW